jgi:hypothetical protein
MNQRQRCQLDAAPASRDWLHGDGSLCQFSTAPTAWEWQIGELSRCHSGAAPAALDWSVNQRQRCQSDAAPASWDWHHGVGGVCQTLTEKQIEPEARELRSIANRKSEIQNHFAIITSTVSSLD